LRALNNNGNLVTSYSAPSSVTVLSGGPATVIRTGNLVNGQTNSSTHLIIRVKALQSYTLRLSAFGLVDDTITLSNGRQTG
jgi:hypothetical protein